MRYLLRVDDAADGCSAVHLLLGFCLADATLLCLGRYQPCRAFGASASGVDDVRSNAVLAQFVR